MLSLMGTVISYMFYRYRAALCSCSCLWGLAPRPHIAPLLHGVTSVPSTQQTSVLRRPLFTCFSLSPFVISFSVTPSQTEVAPTDWQLCLRSPVGIRFRPQLLHRDPDFGSDSGSNGDSIGLARFGDPSCSTPEP